MHLDCTKWSLKSEWSIQYNLYVVKLAYSAAKVFINLYVRILWNFELITQESYSEICKLSVEIKIKYELKWV